MYKNLFSFWIIWRTARAICESFNNQKMEKTSPSSEAFPPEKRGRKKGNISVVGWGLIGSKPLKKQSCFWIDKVKDFSNTLAGWGCLPHSPSKAEITSELYNAYQGS